MQREREREREREEQSWRVISSLKVPRWVVEVEGRLEASTMTISNQKKKKRKLKRLQRYLL